MKKNKPEPIVSNLDTNNVIVQSKNETIASQKPLDSNAANKGRYIGQKKTFKEKLARWYSFNKRKLPMFVMVISLILFTAFLDIKVGNKEVLQTHFTAFTKLADPFWGNLPAVIIFIFFLLPLLGFIITLNFSKNGRLIFAILLTILSLLGIALLGLYIYSYVHETIVRTDYKINTPAINSFIIYSLGVLTFVGSTILTWVYVNYKYVKEK
ncbi:MAG: hypothetical protein LBV55_02890 [Acholeplasmatales bacterium]|jgi:hypothetical protein|nr:hypothetical protein [Acholeplasmatales bacterium]